ncbi:MAG: hypothetical protein QW728_05760, partial [Thermoplasmata archaeon]
LSTVSLFIGIIGLIIWFFSDSGSPGDTTSNISPSVYLILIFTVAYATGTLLLIKAYFSSWDPDSAGSRLGIIMLVSGLALTWGKLKKAYPAAGQYILIFVVAVSPVILFAGGFPYLFCFLALASMICYLPVIFLKEAGIVGIKSPISNLSTLSRLSSDNSVVVQYRGVIASSVKKACLELIHLGYLLLILGYCTSNLLSTEYVVEVPKDGQHIVVDSYEIWITDVYIKAEDNSLIYNFRVNEWVGGRYNSYDGKIGWSSGMVVLYRKTMFSGDTIFTPSGFHNGSIAVSIIHRPFAWMVWAGFILVVLGSIGNLLLRVCLSSSRLMKSYQKYSYN